MRRRAFARAGRSLVQEERATRQCGTTYVKDPAGRARVGAHAVTFAFAIQIGLPILPGPCVRLITP